MVSRLCRLLNPTWIDAYALDCISESCRLLQSAEGEVTHRANGNNRDAPGKENMNASSSGLASLPLVSFASELPFVGKSDLELDE
jgi:hypothetical protein